MTRFARIITRPNTIAAIGAVVVACAGDAAVQRSDTGTPSMMANEMDSAGWRVATLAHTRLRLRYPIRVVRGVSDLRSPTCTPRMPADSAFDDILVVTSARADFVHVAAGAGFEPASYGWNVLDDSGIFTGNSWRVDTLDVGTWRGVYGEVRALTYIMEDAVPPPVFRNDSEHTMEPEPLRRGRLFAMGPAVAGCAVVLAWRGRSVRERIEGFEPGSWTKEELRGLFLYIARE